MNFPEDLLYTEDHEWVRVDGDAAFIGITDHAQSELGDIVYVDIEDELDEVEKGGTFGTIEAVKTVADMYAPASGSVAEINKMLEEDPEIINKDPYGDGWILKITLSDKSELDDLLDVQAYKELIGQ